MSDLANYAENHVASWVAGHANPPSITSRYLALYTAVTDAEAGTGTEVSGGGYARVEVSTKLGAVSGGVIVSTSDITFPEATATQGFVTHAALRDASTGGNALTALKALPSGVTIDAGDIFRIAASTLTLTVT